MDYEALAYDGEGGCARCTGAASASDSYLVEQAHLGRWEMQVRRNKSGS